MSESADIELLHRAWEAMSGAGDLSVLEGAPAEWCGVMWGMFALCLHPLSGKADSALLDQMDPIAARTGVSGERPVECP
jgi:hypothetical protein